MSSNYAAFYTSFCLFILVAENLNNTEDEGQKIYASEQKTLSDVDLADQSKQETWGCNQQWFSLLINLQITLAINRLIVWSMKFQKTVKMSRWCRQIACFVRSTVWKLKYSAYYHTWQRKARNSHIWADGVQHFCLKMTKMINHLIKSEYMPVHFLLID